MNEPKSGGQNPMKATASHEEHLYSAYVERGVFLMVTMRVRPNGTICGLLFAQTVGPEWSDKHVLIL